MAHWETNAIRNMGMRDEAMGGTELFTRDWVKGYAYNGPAQVPAKEREVLDAVARFRGGNATFSSASAPMVLRKHDRIRQQERFARQQAARFATVGALDPLGQDLSTRNATVNPTDIGTVGPLTSAIRNEFMGAYATDYSHLETLLSAFGIKVVRSDAAYNAYSVRRTSPYPAYQHRGTAPVTRGFDFLAQRVDNFAYALRIAIHQDDWDDDQMGAISPGIAEGGSNFASLIVRLFIQLITDTTDSELQPYIPVAADGAPMYSTTDGDGANRFGLALGNTTATLGASPDAQTIREWYQDVKAQFRQMTDPHGQPLIPPRAIDEEGITLVYGPGLEKEMNAAFRQKLVFEIDGTAGSANAAAAPTNVILDMGDPLTLYNTPYIPASDKRVWAFLNSSRIERPVVWQIRRDMYEVNALEGVSDSANDTQQVYRQFRMRAGMAPMVTFPTIRSAAA